MARKLSKAKKKQYAEARRKRLAQKALKAADLSGETNTNGSQINAALAVPLTPTQKLHQTQLHSESLSRRLDEVVAENAALRQKNGKELHEQAVRYNDRLNNLQSEVARLRSLLANITFGGQHVREIESVGQGAA